jgi:hypothetical protein
MRLIEHTPKKWADFVRSRSPIAESVVPVDCIGRRNWSAMRNAEILGFAQWFVYDNSVGNRTGLQSADSGLYSVLIKRKLIGGVDFKGGQRSWKENSDEELVSLTQSFVDENAVEGRKGLERADGRLYSVLVRRKLLDKVKFKADERAWSKYSDDELVEYAQRFIEENEIKSRSGLQSADNGLYRTLHRRKLIDWVEFKADERAWHRHSDDGLVEYAQKFVDENGIESRKGLQRAEGGLYWTLIRRELIDKVDFKGDERAWRRYSDDELVEYAQRFVEEGIESRKGLERADGRLYSVLVRRKLLDKVKFKADERAWSKYSDDELVEYAQRFVDGKEIRSRSGLDRADGGLYSALRKRKLVNEIEFEADERAWSRYSDDELVDYAQRFVEENEIASRKGLAKIGGGLYQAMRGRKLIDKVTFKADERAWRFYSDDELVEYAQRYIKESGIQNRKGLERADIGLYSTLIQRKLIGRVFSSVEQNRDSLGIEEISDAMDEFGGEECD